jgi:hypothetical protein
MTQYEVVRKDERKCDCGQNMKEKEDEKNQGATDILTGEPDRGQSHVQQHAKASKSALVSGLIPSLITDPTRTSLAWLWRLNMDLLLYVWANFALP